MQTGGSSRRPGTQSWVHSPSSCATLSKPIISILKGVDIRFPALQESEMRLARHAHCPGSAPIRNIFSESTVICVSPGYHGVFVDQPSLGCCDTCLPGSSARAALPLLQQEVASDRFFLRSSSAKLSKGSACPLTLSTYPQSPSSRQGQ